MRRLTAQQEKVLASIAEHCRRQGFPPTLREIGKEVGLPNVNAVRGHVAALEKKGFIAREADKARSIRIVHAPSRLSRIKRAMHQVARTDRGVVHRVVYGLCLACPPGEVSLAGDMGRLVHEALQRECVEHEWRMLQLGIQDDHLVLRVEVWPNHSPQLTARRVRWACEAVRRTHRKGRRPLLAKGYAVTTDATMLDEVVAQFLAGRDRSASEPDPTPQEA